MTEIGLPQIEQKYLRLWQARPDGDGFRTATSYLRPVIYQNKAAMLKIVTNADEKNAADALRFYGGSGAVALFEAQDDAMLIERATDDETLLSLLRDGRDDEATRIICSVVRQLHAPRRSGLPKTTPLKERFRSLDAARDRDLPASSMDLFSIAVKIADNLLVSQSDVIVLHGDIHHENILHDSDRGWLAIDPKGLTGERTYDYANTLCNPQPMPDIAHDAKRFCRQCEIICDEAGLDKQRLTNFAFVHSCLNAAWSFEDGTDVQFGLKMAEIIRPLL